MSTLLAAIPYHTFPDLVKVGSFQLRTFGLMVGIGVLIGAWSAGVYGETFGIDREDTYRLATRLVVAGVIGARISWDLSHTDLIDSPLDLIAVWKGGLQFSGGFIAAVLVAWPTFRSWSRLTRWRMVDGFALGLSIGLAFGRVGCTSVGEHFGSTWGSSWFPLMVRYTRDPGPNELREPTLGTLPVTKGVIFHNTAIYELIWLVLLFVLIWKVLHRKPAVAPGTGIALFCAIYAPLRFGSDFLRINDNLVAGLTGAQYLMLAVMGASIWLIFKVRPTNAALQLEEEAELAKVGALAAEAVNPTTTDADDDGDAIGHLEPDPGPESDTDAGTQTPEDDHSA